MTGSGHRGSHVHSGGFSMWHSLGSDRIYAISVTLSAETHLESMLLKLERWRIASGTAAATAATAAAAAAAATGYTYFSHSQPHYSDAQT